MHGLVAALGDTCCFLTAVGHSWTYCKKLFVSVTSELSTNERTCARVEGIFKVHWWAVDPHWLLDSPWVLDAWFPLVTSCVPWASMGPPHG